MITYRYFKNLFIDGGYFKEGFLDLDWFPSDKAKRQAADYEREIGKVLMEIAAHNWAGLAVITEIGNSKREIVIKPDETWESKRQEAPHAAPERYGSRLIVAFSPASAGSMKCHAGERAARRASEILLHELVHALRMGLGLWQPAKFGKESELVLYGNREEFLAILITNIYMSELRRGPLRGQWVTTPDDCDVLRGELATSTGFLKADSRLLLVVALCKAMPALFNNLAQAKAAFNPVAEYLANKAAYDARVDSLTLRPD